MSIYTNSTNLITVTSLSQTKQTSYGYLFLLFIPILTILGNTLVMLAVLCDKQLYKTVTNRYIAALAFSDFLVGLIPMPLAVYVKVNGEQWNLGVGLCKFYVACDVTSSTASILHLLVISADRYLAIAAPAEYQRYARKAKITFAIVLVWLISITLSIPVVMGKSILNTTACWLENPEYMIYSSLLSFYIPAGVLTLVYLKIFRKIRVRQGIHTMLRAGGAGSTEVTPFHLPFVVVQEVSFDEQNSSTEKRQSDTVTASNVGTTTTAAVDVLSDSNIQFPVRAPSPTVGPPPGSPVSNEAADGRGHYQLINNDDENKSMLSNYPQVTKSKTFPGALKKEVETHFFSPNPQENLSSTKNEQEKKNMSSELEKCQEFYKRQSLDIEWLRSQQQKYQHQNSNTDTNGIKLLARTSSEKRPSEYKDTAVQTQGPRRLSLWFHHSCTHIEELASPNGNCFVIEPETVVVNERAKSISVATRGRRIISKAFDTSIGPLKRVQTRRKTRRSSSLIMKSTSSEIGQKQSFSAEHSGISASTSIDFRADVCTSSTRRRASSAQADEETEDEDEETTVYGIRGPITKNKHGFNLKKLANRVTNALHRITETQAVTKEKKATKLVALILGIFVISWLPFFTFNTMRGICLSATSSESDCDWLNSHIFFFTSWLGYANSSFNPIIYALVNQHFRRTYKRLLGWPLKRRS